MPSLSSTIKLTLVSYWIRGFFISVLPFTTLTLFDTALPAKSQYSIIVLFSIAVVCSLIAYSIQSQCEALFKSTISIPKSELKVPLNEIPDYFKVSLKSLQSQSIFSLAELFWVIPLLGFVLTFMPKVGFIVVMVTVVTAMLSFLFGPTIIKLIQNPVTYLLIFSAGFLVVEGDASVGVITFIMFTGGRIINGVASLFGNLSDIRHTLLSMGDTTPFVTDTYHSKLRNKAWLMLGYSLVLLGVASTLSFLPIDRAVTLTGISTKQNETVQITSPITGLLTNLEITEGTSVQKGDVLATVTSQTDSQLLPSLLTLDRLNKEADEIDKTLENLILLRRTRLNEMMGQLDKKAIRRELVTLAEIDLQDALLRRQETRSAYAQRITEAGNRVRTLRTELKLSKIIAPVSGEVDQLYTTGDQSIVVGNPVLSIVPEGYVVVEGIALASDREFLEEGKTVILTKTNIGDRNAEEIHGTITRASPLLDEKTQTTFRVTIRPSTPLPEGEPYTINAITGSVVILTWLTSSFTNSVSSASVR